MIPLMVYVNQDRFWAIDEQENTYITRSFINTKSVFLLHNHDTPYRYKKTRGLFGHDPVILIATPCLRLVGRQGSFVALAWTEGAYEHDLSIAFR